jgi:hypothetical protein
VPGTRNGLNARTRSLHLADPSRRPPAPPIDAAALAGHVLDRIGMATRLAMMVAAKHQANGCPSPNTCRPCAAEQRRQRDEERRQYQARARADRAAVERQHHESAARLAEIAARRRPRRDLADMALHAPACATCKDTLHGGRVCKSCGLAHYGDVSMLDTINRTGGRR